MKKGRKEKDKVVKINSDLLSQVEEFINKKENKFKYANKKQFIDIAVYEMLKKGGGNEFRGHIEKIWSEN